MFLIFGFGSVAVQSMSIVTFALEFCAFVLVSLLFVLSTTIILILHFGTVTVPSVPIVILFKCSVYLY